MSSIREGLAVNIQHLVDDVVKVTAYMPRARVSGGRRFRPVDGVHTLVKHGGSAVWVDVDTGELCAVSDIQRGALRSRSAFLSRVLAHSWDWFGTLTLDARKLPSELSRRSDAVVPYVYGLFQRYKLSTGDAFRYAIVPEQHKDGAWHFHVLLAGVDASHITPARRGGSDVYIRGQRVFWLAPFQLGVGFTSLTAVRSSLAVGRYMAKYMAKSFNGASARGVGFRRWSCSRNVTPAPITHLEGVALALDAWHAVDVPTLSGDPSESSGDGDGGSGGGATPIAWVRWGLASDDWVVSLMARASALSALSG